jgi:peroxiredoxin
MLEVGDTIPDVTVQSVPGKKVRLRELAAEGPILLLFYLFDWSST